MLDDLTTRDQRMMFGLVTLVHLADNKEQLDSDTETLYSTARKHLCQLSTLRWQQKDGLDTVLPYGLRKIQALRTLTTESTAVLIPFRAQEIMQPNGLVLWAERRQQEHDCGRSASAAQWQQLSVGCVWLRQEHERQGRNRADCAFHRG